MDKKTSYRNCARKILIALGTADGPAPLEYIFLHTGIKDPLKILKKMDEKGLVRQSRSSNWSHCMSPMFEITPIGRKEMLT